MSNPVDEVLKESTQTMKEMQDQAEFEHEVLNLMRPALEKIAARFGQNQWLHLTFDFKHNTGAEESIDIADLSLTMPISNSEA